MIAPLNEIIGLPLTTPATDLACAAEKCGQILFDVACAGDVDVQRKIVELRVASLIWAYGNRENRHLAKLRY